MTKNFTDIYAMMMIIPQEPNLTAAKCRFLYVYIGMEDLLNENKDRDFSNIYIYIKNIREIYTLITTQNANDEAINLLQNINYYLSEEICNDNNNLNQDIIEQLHQFTCDALNPTFKYQYEKKYSDDNIIFNKILISYNCNKKFKDELITPTYANIK